MTKENHPNNLLIEWPPASYQPLIRGAKPWKAVCNLIVQDVPDASRQCCSCFWWRWRWWEDGKLKTKHCQLVLCTYVEYVPLVHLIHLAFETQEMMSVLTKLATFYYFIQIQWNIVKWAKNEGKTIQREKKNIKRVLPIELLGKTKVQNVRAVTEYFWSLWLADATDEMTFAIWTFFWPRPDFLSSRQSILKTRLTIFGHNAIVWVEQWPWSWREMTIDKVTVADCVINGPSVWLSCRAFVQTEKEWVIFDLMFSQAQKGAQFSFLIITFILVSINEMPVMPIISQFIRLCPHFRPWKCEWFLCWWVFNKSRW